MFKVFIDYDKMCDICLEQDNADTWYKILCEQQSINVNHSVSDDEFYNENNPLFIFSQMNDVEFNNEASYMNEVCEHNEKVLENPCSAFVLNIDTTKAKEITSRFGVLCQSVDEMSACPLTIGDVTITTIKPDSWRKRLPFGKVLPSNSMVIVDRYLFGSENDETLQDSYDNVRDLMEAFMPDSLDTTYHLCIIFDTNHIQDRDIKSLLDSDKSKNFTEDEKKMAFGKISSKLNKIKNEFVKEHLYPVVLEVLSCDRRAGDAYQKTHDRKVISNYFYATATHKLKAFRNEQPLVRQQIGLLSIYGKGIDDTLSDVPQIAHSYDINDLRYLMREAKSHPKLHNYSVNGNTNISLSEAKNRILV